MDADLYTLMLIADQKRYIAAGKVLSPNLQSPTSAAAWIVSEQQPELYETDPEAFKVEKAKAASAIAVLVTRGALAVVKFDNKTKEGGDKYALSEDSAWPDVPKAG
jgi:hypothetical protein